MPIPDDVPTDAIPKVDAAGCDNAQAAGSMFDEDEEEEEEIPLWILNVNNYFVPKQDQSQAQPVR